MSEEDIIDYTKESSIRLNCDCAWRPMKNVYDILCGYFDLEMVFMAEELDLESITVPIQRSSF